MRDATYVVLALALCMIASVFIVQTVMSYRPEISMFELKEFTQLPLEIQGVLREVLLPNKKLTRQYWDSLTPPQKRIVLDHIKHQVSPPPPAVEEQLPVLIPPTPVPDPEPEPVSEQSPDAGMKKGFLLTETKKTHTKNKKKDKAETLVEVVASPEEPPATPTRRRGGGSDSGFLGGDE